MSKKQWVGTFAALAVVAFFVFGGQAMDMFNSNSGVDLPNGENTEGEVQSAVDASLAVEDRTVGSGEVAAAGDLLTVHYTGWLEDGSQFDSSRDRGVPFQFVLGAGQVIPGWDQGLVGMMEGGTRVLTIPADLAYGPAGYGPIPPNATLTFEIELVEVAKQ